MFRRTLAIVFAATLSLAEPTAAADLAGTGASGLKVVSRIAGPDGGWDYASFDPARRRVYVAHGMTVTAIDADSGAVTAAFAQGNHLHAVVPVPGADLIVTTNSGDSSARIISASTGELVASVATAADPDAAIYDPSSGLVLVMGGDSATITFVDPKAAKATGTILVGGALEFAALDHKGRLFVNREDKNDIAVVDLAARKVVATYAMPGCVRPTGLALVAGDRLISACGNGVAKILDAASGREIASLAIGAGPDAVISDPDRALAYVPSGRTGTLAVIALSGPQDNTIIDTVRTDIGARTGALDPKTGRIYLPTADYLPPAAAGQRPSVKPGSFHVIVVGRN